MSSIGMGNSPMPNVNTAGGLSALVANGMTLSGGTPLAAGTAGYTGTAMSPTSTVSSGAGTGITINVNVPASTSPNAIAQTTKAVANAVQQGVARANARSN
jgi:hypothetical protein